MEYAKDIVVWKTSSHNVGFCGAENPAALEQVILKLERSDVVFCRCNQSPF